MICCDDPQKGAARRRKWWCTQRMIRKGCTEPMHDKWILLNKLSFHNHTAPYDIQYDMVQLWHQSRKLKINIGFLYRKKRFFSSTGCSIVAVCRFIFYFYCDIVYMNDSASNLKPLEPWYYCALGFLQLSLNILFYLWTCILRSSLSV